MAPSPSTARLVLAVLAAALLAVPALAEPALAGPVLATDAGEVTWSVQPSGPDGPDGRTALDYQVAPGTTISDHVAVTNFSAGPATFRVYAADATTDYDTGSFTLVGADQASTDTGAWTAVGSGPSLCADTNDDAEASCAAGLGVPVTLEPGAQAQVPFTITVPADATPGDHAAGIVAAFEQQTTDATGSAVQVAQRVGTRIYLRVDGPLTSSVRVSGTVAGYDGSLNPVAAGTGRVGFDVTNTGNVRLSASPQVSLTGPFGIDLGTVTLDPVANLMPGGTAHVDAMLADVPPLLLLSADVTVTPLPADGAAAQGDTPPSAVHATAQAWAVPWTALGIAVLVVGGVWLLVWWRRRSRSLLAAELAAYTEQVRAEARSAEAPSAPEPSRVAAPLPSGSTDESETVR